MKNHYSSIDRKIVNDFWFNPDLKQAELGLKYGVSRVYVGRVLTQFIRLSDVKRREILNQVNNTKQEENG